MAPPSKKADSRLAACALVRTASTNEQGDILPYIGRFMPNAVLAAFEATGGQEQFNTWATENYSDFAKTFLAKMLPRQVAVSQSTSGIEDALAELERRTIDIDATEIDRSDNDV